MSIGAYLKDKIIIILLNLVGLLFLLIYLPATGNTFTTAGLLALVWILTGLTVLLVNYELRKKHFRKIDQLMDRLDQPYLVQEMMDYSWRLEDKLYRDLLFRSNKAVIEQIHQLREEQREYREYLEGWIHEVKLPITGMRLVCHHQNDMHRMELYLTEMEHLVEQALFYAKSDLVYQDFQIRETDLKKTVTAMIQKNKYLLRQNKMNIQIKMETGPVCSDPKWLEFILTQIMINAVKYKKADQGEICFSAEENAAGTTLTVKDNGIGIPPEEQGRVFDKGFTGTNGREREKSTGIGLYLCRKLCRKLEIHLSIASAVGEYTCLSLFFPKNDYLLKPSSGEIR